MLNQRRTEVHRVATHQITDELSKTMEELLKLPPGDRIDLAMALWDSLSDAEYDAEFPLTDAQRAKLRRRVAEHDADPSTAIPWDVVRQRLRNRGGSRALNSEALLRKRLLMRVTGTTSSCRGLATDSSTPC
jgi:putative addiction module component (TIGR02574 family)